MNRLALKAGTFTIVNPRVANSTAITGAANVPGIIATRIILEKMPAGR